MKNFISSIAIYWDKQGELIFGNVGFTNIASEKQSKAIQKLTVKLQKIVIREAEKINKIV